MSGSGCDRFADATLLGARVLIAILFVFEGLAKARGYAAASAYMQRFGVWPALLPLVILLELGGGVLLALGLGTRHVATALGVFCLTAAALFHHDFANRGDVLHLEKDLAIAGGLFALAVGGGGSFAVAMITGPWRKPR